MAQYSVTIPPRLVAAVRRDAAAAVPTECCGALIGLIEHGRIEVRCVVPVPNAATRDDRYLIDADVVLRLERQADCAGLQLVGFYHSHPVGAACPSQTDIESACPGFLYLIVQPEDGTLRGWRLCDDRSGFAELPIALVGHADAESQVGAGLPERAGSGLLRSDTESPHPASAA